MPQSRPNPTRPTRARTATRPVAAPASVPRKTAVASKSEKPRLDPNDAGVKRRARKRAARRRNNLAAWVVVAGLSVVVAGAATGVWQEYQTVKKKIGIKEATLSDLRAQLERGQRRVQALATREGKERALVEGGYLGEGERFLLFPQPKKKKGE